MTVTKKITAATFERDVNDNIKISEFLYYKCKCKCKCKYFKILQDILGIAIKILREILLF